MIRSLKKTFKQSALWLKLFKSILNICRLNWWDKHLIKDVFPPPGLGKVKC